MLNLESAFLEWRQKILAAGIKTPVPLEELEIHLRDEIGEVVKSGVDEQKAFDAAVEQMGKAEALKNEFRSPDFMNWLGDGPQARINRIFALLWLAYLSWGFFQIAGPLSRLVFGHVQNFQVSSGFLMAFIFGIIFVWGIAASIRIFGGNYKGIRPLKFIAVLGIVGFISQVTAHRTVSAMAILLLVFSMMSLFLLRQPGPAPSPSTTD